MKQLLIRNSFTFAILGLILLFSLTLLYKYDDSGTHFIEVEVAHGETLWNLAKNYGSEQVDIAKFVSHIEKENNLNGKTLKAGDVLRIPVDKSQDMHLTMNE